MLNIFPAALLSLITMTAAAEPLTARFEMITAVDGVRRTAEFTLIRAEDVVEVQDQASGTVERWERDPTGKLFYSRTFIEAGKIIEFMPADFASAGISDEWDTIRSVLSPTRLGEMRPAGHGRMLGLRTARYREEVDGMRIAIEWLATEALPARISRRGSGISTDLVLKQLIRGDDALEALTPASRLGTFERIDFADLGDREGDPVFEQLIAQGGMALHRH
jgi:hypothetical protein